MEQYDEQQTNFLRIKNHKQILNTGRITEDVVEDFKTFLVKIREYFPNFNQVNEDIQSKQFRTIAGNTEMIFQAIENQYKNERIFNVDLYKQLVENMIFMIEYTNEEDVLLGMMLSTQIQ